MKRSMVGSAGVLTAAALVLTGCGGDGGTETTAEPGTEPVTITFTWWGNDDRAARYEEAIDLFEAEYDWITVQTGFADFTPYWESRTTEAAGRSLPDVFQFDSAYLREYAEYEHILDLQQYIDDGTIDLSGYDQTLVEAGRLNDQQVAIPTSTNTLAMFISPDVLEETGVSFPGEGYTWADLGDFVAEVSAAEVETGDGYKIYGSADYTGTFWFFLQYLVQQGQAPFTDDGELAFDESDVIDWLNLTADLRADSAVYPTERTVALAPLTGFAVNEVASESSWDNFLAGYEADSGKDNIELLPIPSGPDGTRNFFRPSMHLAAGANTDHPHEAALLIDFLLTDPEVGAIFGTSKGVPGASAQREAIEAEEGSVDARVIAYEEEIGATETSTAPIPVSGFGTIEAAWKTLGEELGYGSLTPEDFASRWFAEAERSIG